MSSSSSDRDYPRTELVWPGKRTQVERVALLFQIAETINQSRATREETPLMAHLTPGPSPLAERGGSRGEVWTNKLIWGENKYVLASLLAGDPSIGLEPLAGKIDLIYIDLPFATGQDFSYRVRVGDEQWPRGWGGTGLFSQLSVSSLPVKHNKRITTYGDWRRREGCNHWRPHQRLTGR